MGVEFNSQKPVKGTIVQSDSTNVAGTKKSELLFEKNKKASQSPTMYFYFPAEEMEILDVVTSGKPLITSANSRYNGKVFQSTGQAISVEVLQNVLKQRKNLDKDQRLVIELEIARQQQGGYLTPEQQQQYTEICKRKASEDTRLGQLLNAKM